MKVGNQLKGVNITGLAAQSISVITTQFDAMVLANVKLLRLNLKQFQDDITHALDSASLILFLDLVESYGFKLIVNMPPKNTDSGLWVSVATIMGYWDEYIAEIGEHNAVYVYEPANEPDLVVDWWTDGMQQGIDKIRTFSTKPIIVTEGFGWGFAGVDPAIFSDDNLWWSHHEYDPKTPNYTHQGVSPAPYITDSYGLDLYGASRLLNKTIFFDKENIRRHLKVIRDWQKQYDVTIFTGEFSAHNGGRNADFWVRDMMDVFNEYNWMWCYHDWSLPVGVGYSGWRPLGHRMSILKQGWRTEPVKSVTKAAGISR